MRKKLNKTTRVIRRAAFAVAAILVAFTCLNYRNIKINDDLADAVRFGDRVRVEECLNDGGDPNAEVSVLHTGITFVERIRSVFYHRTWPDDITHTLLDYSCELAHPTIMRMLLDKGADPNKSNNKSYPTLVLAINSGSVPKVKLLIDHGAIVNESRPTMLPPLVAAAIVGSGEMIDLLTQKGAQVNYNSKLWDTALNNAVYHCEIDAIRHLIAAGADVTIRDTNGRLPSEIAREKRCSECVALLEDAMAKRKAAGSGGLKK